MMLNLNGEQVCALEHVLRHALTAQKWVATKNGTGGVWVNSHSAIHKTAVTQIIEKIEKKELAR